MGRGAIVKATARGGVNARPLRVLIPTTRYSTYIQHSSRDIAAAFEAAGCVAQVMIEPDASTTTLGWAYAREVEAFEPDLVVMVNYPRWHLAGVLPEGLPYACWVQDAMGHLFAPAAAGLAARAGFRGGARACGV